MVIFREFSKESIYQNLSIHVVLLIIIDQANYCTNMDVRMYNTILILCGDYGVVNK